MSDCPHCKKEIPDHFTSHLCKHGLKPETKKILDDKFDELFAEMEKGDKGLFGLGVVVCASCSRTYSVEPDDRNLCCICERDHRLVGKTI